MTYEYLCSACGHEWEADQSINDKPLKKCPSCKKLKAQRQISGGAGFILKGGGWYADGYASTGSSKAGSSKANSSSTDSTSSSSSSTDSTSSNSTSTDSTSPSTTKKSSKKPSGEAA